MTNHKAIDQNPLVYVCWLDSRAVGPGWVLIENLENRVLFCHSVGWVVSKSEKSWIIAPHYAEAPEQINGALEIPVVSILSVTELTEKNSRKSLPDPSVNPADLS